MTFYYEDMDKVVAHNAEVLADGDSMFVKAGVTIGSSTDWDGVDAVGNASIQVLGTIMSVGGNALHVGGNSSSISIALGGSIIGNLNAGSAIDYDGYNAHIFNDGEVSGSTGITVTHNNYQVYNTGDIHGGNGNAIHVEDSAGLIVNSGTISAAETFAILVDTSSSGFLTLNNSGLIAGGDLFSGAIAMGTGTGPALITNSGTIIGNVILSAENDTFEGSTGRLTGGDLAGLGGDDELYTGDGRNFLDGGAGTDILEGGAGRDTFYFDNAKDSTGPGHDTILDFDARRDIMGFSFTATAIDHIIATGTLRAAHFNAGLVAAVDSAHLAPHHAVLFTPSAGDEKGHTYLIVDANGTAGYQANKDYVVELTNPDNIASFGMDNFLT